MQNLEQNVIKNSTHPAVATRDIGKIRAGAGCRIIVRRPAMNRTADNSRIRFGAGCRIRGFAAMKSPAGSI